MNGDYGFILQEQSLKWRGAVPLLIRTPDTASGDVAGSVCDSPIEWFDVGPTLVELAGGELNFRQFAKSALSRSRRSGERTSHRGDIGIRRGDYVVESRMENCAESRGSTLFAFRCARRSR